MAKDPQYSQALVEGQMPSVPVPPSSINMPPPGHTPLPSPKVASLHSGSTLVQIVDMNNGSSSKEEATRFDEADKEDLAKKIKEGKDKEGSKIISPLSQNPFSLAKTFTLAKKKMFSVDVLGTIGKVLGTNSWLESILEQKRKRVEDSTLNKKMIS